MMLADLASIQIRVDKSNKKNIDDEQLKILEIALNCINDDKDRSILKEKFTKKTLKFNKFMHFFFIRG